MTRIPLGRRRQVSFSPFRWGVYFHLRWVLSWHHVKIGVWSQRGLRVDTRRQVKRKRAGAPLRRRYVNGLRFQVSYWRSSKGHSGKPVVFGLMLYGGSGS